MNEREKILRKCQQDACCSALDCSSAPRPRPPFSHLSPAREPTERAAKMGAAPRAPAEPHRCGTLDARERALLFADAFSRRYGVYTPRPNPRETGLIAQDARRSVPTGWQTESPPTPQQCATMGKIIAACDGSQVERHAMLVERLATPEGERLCAAMLCFAMCCSQLAPDAEPVETVEDECDNSPLEDECDAKKISQVHKLIIGHSL